MEDYADALLRWGKKCKAFMSYAKDACERCGEPWQEMEWVAVWCNMDDAEKEEAAQADYWQ